MTETTIGEKEMICFSIILTDNIGGDEDVLALLKSPVKFSVEKENPILSWLLCYSLFSEHLNNIYIICITWKKWLKHLISRLTSKISIDRKTGVINIMLCCWFDGTFTFNNHNVYERFQDGDTWKFLQESSAMDPRFKNRIDSEEIWQRVKNAAVLFTTTREVQCSLFFLNVKFPLLLYT